MDWAAGGDFWVTHSYAKFHPLQKPFPLTHDIKELPSIVISDTARKSTDKRHLGDLTPTMALNIHPLGTRPLGPDSIYLPLSASQVQCGKPIFRKMAHWAWEVPVHTHT